MLSGNINHRSVSNSVSVANSTNQSSTVITNTSTCSSTSTTTQSFTSGSNNAVGITVSLSNQQQATSEPWGRYSNTLSVSEYKKAAQKLFGNRSGQAPRKLFFQKEQENGEDALQASSISKNKNKQTKLEIELEVQTELNISTTNPVYSLCKEATPEPWGRYSNTLSVSEYKKAAPQLFGNRKSGQALRKLFFPKRAGKW